MHVLLLFLRHLKLCILTNNFGQSTKLFSSLNKKLSLNSYTYYRLRNLMILTAYKLAAVQIS